MERIRDIMIERGRLRHEQRLRMLQAGPQRPQPKESVDFTPLPPPSGGVVVARPPVCPLCHGAGYRRADVPVGHAHFGKPRPCECKKQEIREHRRQHLADLSGLNVTRGDSASASFDTFESLFPGVQDAYDAAIQFAAEPYGWILFRGPNGVGKTHLALAIAKHRLQQQDVVVFQVAPDLLDHLRSAFSPTAETPYDELFLQMKAADLLVIDDLGAEQATEWANEKFFQLLNYRYSQALPTVITTNQSLYDFEPRIRSRLHDRRRVQVVDMDDAQDYREVVE